MDEANISWLLAVEYTVIVSCILDSASVRLFKA